MTISNEPRTRKAYPNGVTQAEIAEAVAVDAKVKEILHAARARGAASPMTTEQSIREGNEFMEKARRNAVIALSERIARKELITEDELRKRLGVNRNWILDAVTANRLFHFRLPSGENYYPAFYGDATRDRQALEQVCQKLGVLPGPSKYYFFTTKSTFLGTKTPLEALADGMLAKVLIAAQGFVER